MKGTKLSRNAKIAIAILLIAVIIGLIAAIILIPSKPDGGEETTTELFVSADETVEVHFIDVGQGDGILIRTGEGDVVIDAGANKTEEEYLMYLKSEGVESIEYLVLTHPHSDHIGGADLLLEELPVEHVVMPNTTHTSAMYINLINQINELEIDIIYAKVNDVLTLGGVKITTLAPKGIDYKNMNNYSVVMRMDFEEASFLFVGDAEVLSEKEMLDGIPESVLDVDVLKVGHHGSTSSSSKDFLAALTPEYAVISCGEGNSYGHPHKATLESFSLIDAAGKLYRTDEDGHIVFTSDGESFEIQTEK